MLEFVLIVLFFGLAFVIAPLSQFNWRWKRRWVASVLVLIILVLLPFWSKSYFGYYFSPPPLHPSLQEWTLLHSVTWLTWNEDVQELEAQKPLDIERIVQREDRSFQPYRIVDTLHRMALSSQSTELPSPELIHAFCQTVQCQHKGLNRGSFAIGRTSTHETLIFAGIVGEMESDDHYTYYEYLCQFNPEIHNVTLLSTRQYYMDVAGIEGPLWYQFIVFGCIGSTLYLGVYTVWRLLVVMYKIFTPRPNSPEKPSST